MAVFMLNQELADEKTDSDGQYNFSATRLEQNEAEESNQCVVVPLYLWFGCEVERWI
jgi:hypothetical protein